MEDKNIKKAIDVYEREIKKDVMEVEIDKNKFIKQIKNGLGDKINDINTYIKKEPSTFEKLKRKIKNFFKYI
jgi:hypothetical protein